MSDSDESENSDIVLDDEYEPFVIKGEDTKSKTTLFLNKYCENPDIPSMANKLADVIIEYEINQSISSQYRNDEENDDETITEQEFVNDVQDLDESEECLSGMKLTCQELIENIDESIDVLINPSESQSINLAEKANEVAKYAVEKMKKICVAPGEEGKFKNWGTDIFIEEKAFP